MGQGAGSSGGGGQVDWVVVAGRVSAKEKNILSVAAAAEHYGFDEAKALDYLRFAGHQVAANWEAMMADEGMPAEEAARFRSTFALVSTIAG